MQKPPPRLFDRRLLRRRLSRALDKRAPDFLIARAADDLEDRLSAIKRPFPRALDLGTPTPHFARALTTPKRPAPMRAALALGPEEQGLRLVVDEEALPFAAASLDLVVSGLALQWVDDLPGAFAQIRRALAPDGLFLACMIGGVSLFELRQALIEAESEISGGASQRVSPFVDMRDLGSLLQRAGFALPVTDVDSFTLRYDSMLALCAELHLMGAGNVLRARRPLPRRALLRAAEIYAQKFSDPDGRVRATIEIVWLSGWAPHESQQKPLKPGSAEMRLEDAVKAAREGK
ncbi:methyltransferase domain-containing protein [Methylocystis bryophila]|uniref:SAM-dependent methyltransferase n=1 Tax=Methylocystis bryophila TaxID=655015 RepID=A0A1W6N043_9HYPH|nr:methyltransferase domain-containing protein [Methylocystis bryophila]ARN83195.1 SAM-dependent methyltransferase [Methylocystis bryophila]BDV39534.1 methyltransferase [Methylocystis bryophila]